MEIQKDDKHLTASVWIISRKTPKKILLIHHKKYNKWLQPGGHVERYENPIEAAVREVKEETGINLSILKDDLQIIGEEAVLLPKPSYMMEQFIPAYKSEPEHFHLDCMYVVTIAKEKITKNPLEAHNIGWFSKDEALKLPMHSDSYYIINQLL